MTAHTSEIQAERTKSNEMSLIQINTGLILMSERHWEVKMAAFRADMLVERRGRSGGRLPRRRVNAPALPGDAAGAVKCRGKVARWGLAPTGRLRNLTAFFPASLVFTVYTFLG